MALSPRTPVIVAYGRSPIGKASKGVFKETNPIEIAGQTLAGVLKKVPELNPILIEDVLVGCALQENYQNYNVARQISFRAALPDETTAQTICRLCSSGLQSIASAANSIIAGEMDICAAGGVESMSTTSMILAEEQQFAWFRERRPTVYDPPAVTAEKVARMCGVSREKQDAFSSESHRRAALAQDNGWFDDQIVPIVIRSAQDKDIIVTRDEGIRKETSPEILSTLKTLFSLEGSTVTAGNSSQKSDGAGFVVLMALEKAQQQNIKPIATFRGFTTAGLAPEYMGLGPTLSVPKLLGRLGLAVDQMDTIEINEAFAAQAVPCIEQLGLPSERTNPEGGAIAMGHPLGATGAILVCKAISHLHRTGGKYGLITMCVSGGIGASGVIEML